MGSGIGSAFGMIGSGIAEKKQQRYLKKAQQYQYDIAQKQLKLQREAFDLQKGLFKRGIGEYDQLRRNFGAGRTLRDELFRNSSRLLTEGAAATGNIRGGGFARAYGGLALDAAERARQRAFQEQAAITGYGLGAGGAIAGLGGQAGQLGFQGMTDVSQLHVARGASQARFISGIFNQAGQGISGSIQGGYGGGFGGGGGAGGGTSIQGIQGIFGGR